MLISVSSNSIVGYKATSVPFWSTAQCFLLPQESALHSYLCSPGRKEIQGENRDPSLLQGGGGQRSAHICFLGKGASLLL